jgi:hypothetical protein
MTLPPGSSLAAVRTRMRRTSLIQSAQLTVLHSYLKPSGPTGFIS